VAEVLSNENQSFVLWILASGLCATRSDFDRHFGDDFLATHVLDDLHENGFISDNGVQILLTSPGKSVVASLQLQATHPEISYTSASPIIGNKAIYKAAYDRALAGKSRSLFQRILFRFEDHYSQQSREAGERDGRIKRERDGYPDVAEKRIQDAN
jgi:hypothetical protein